MAAAQSGTERLAVGNVLRACAPRTCVAHV